MMQVMAADDCLLVEMSRRSAVAVAPGPGRYHGFSAMKLPLGSPEAFQLDIKF